MVPVSDLMDKTQRPGDARVIIRVAPFMAGLWGASLAWRWMDPTMETQLGTQLLRLTYAVTSQWKANKRVVRNPTEKEDFSPLSIAAQLRASCLAEDVDLGTGTVSHGVGADTGASFDLMEATEASLDAHPTRCASSACGC
jgi:hypothetical protein